MNGAAAARYAEAPNRPLRVMIVDDAVTVRARLSNWIAAESDLQVVAALRTGRAAVEQITRVNPDVVILDVDMPELDGISALPLLLAKKRDLVVIMASALTRQHAEVSLRALMLGAADYVAKPAAGTDPGGLNFRRELFDKIRGLGRRSPGARISASPPLRQRLRVPATARNVAEGESGAPQIALRPPPTLPPRVLLIGASTGGPQAIATLLAGLGETLNAIPVLITQHMPPTFTTILAEHIGRLTRRPSREAEHEAPVLPGHIYVGRGGAHMRVARRGNSAVTLLDYGSAINFCRPAVDPLFSSAAEVWSSWNAAVVLTGMGSDGLRGAADVVEAGGSVIAQDESSSVVWGMPGAVAQAGLCSAVLPLDRIAPALTRWFTGAPS